MHLQLIWMYTSIFKTQNKYIFSCAIFNFSAVFSENKYSGYFKVDVLAMILQGLLILGVYWVSEAYQALAAHR